MKGDDGSIWENRASVVGSQHIPHLQEVPTGFAEDGASWLDTNNTLVRQNFGFDLATSSNPVFGSDPPLLLTSNGISTAPGNAEAIVDFFSDALFGGALSPAERQSAVDYLNTDPSGVPAPYDDSRIRETVAIMLGYPQFQEQ